MAKQAVIIGAGVIGACTAYYLAQRGFQVSLADRAGPDDEGCSFGNAGLVVPSHFVPLAAPGMVALGLKWMWNPESPFHIKPRLNRDLFEWSWRFFRAANARHVERSAPVLRDLNLAGRACFEELAGIAGADFGFERKGLLMLCKTAHGFEEEIKVAGQAHRFGLRAEVLDSRQAAQLEPNIRMDIAGAVYFADDCHLTPSRFMHWMRKLLEEAGVSFCWRTEVTGCRMSGNRMEALRTSRGEMAADEFVLCGGSWSPIFARQAGLKLSLQAGKGYSLTLPNPRRAPQIPAILTEARVAVTPMQGALRVGGTMEIAGLNEEIQAARVRGLIKAIPNYYPEFTLDDFKHVPPWCGLRPCSPDGLPYVGRTARCANLSLATGHAMLGLSLGPITGKLVAEILSGEKPSVPIDLLNPDR